MSLSDDKTAWLQQLGGGMGGAAKSLVGAVPGMGAAVDQASHAKPVDAKKAAADKKKADDAKKKEDALIEAGNKAHGLVKTNISLMIQNVKGEFVRDLRIWGNATADNGEDGIAQFVASMGVYLAKDTFMPPGAVLKLMDTSNHLEVEFTVVRLPSSIKGAIHLKAVERGRKGEDHANKSRSTMNGEEVKGSAEVDLEVVKLGGEGTKKHERSEGSETGHSEETITGTGMYDVTVE